MPKFFVTENEIFDDTIHIKDTDAKHLINVLRAKLGDEIIVCDSKGSDYFCKISDIGKKEIQVKIIEQKPCLSEPSTKITLFQALPKSDKLELIIQKCVEIGIFEIIPIMTTNTIIKPDSFEKKLERYNKISESAAKQSGRGIIPKIGNCLDLPSAIKLAGDYEKAFVCYENEAFQKPKSYLKDAEYKNICFFIGPEGGFTKEEINKLTENEIISISLGKRILRTETAGMVFLSILLYEIGDL